MHQDQIIAGRIVAGAIALAINTCLSRPIDAEEIDALVEKYILDNGGVPALKNYKPPFTDMVWNHSLCLSLNKEVVHGVPANKRIVPTDLIKVDLVVKVGEWHADAARTFSANKRYKRIIADSQEMLHIAAGTILPNAPINRFGVALAQLAEHYNYHIPDLFCGHGIGKQIHEEPSIYNVPDFNYTECFIPKKTYAVEPVIMENECIISIDRNGWTYMADTLSTHNENTYWVDNQQIRNITDVESFL